MNVVCTYECIRTYLCMYEKKGWIYKRKVMLIRYKELKCILYTVYNLRNMKLFFAKNYFMGDHLHTSKYDGKVLRFIQRTYDLDI